jgi:hypothetical protein
MTATRRSRRPAFSMMMVTAVVAIAAIMGLAILNSSTLQASASANQDRAVGADAFAESGINVALYYLQNLHDNTKCPPALQALTVNGTPYTQNNVSLGANIPGKFSLRITRPNQLQYQVISTGNATVGTGSVSRALTTTVDVNYYGYAIMAPNATTALTIPANTTYSGNLFVPAGSTSSGGGGGGLLGGLIGGVIKTVTDVLGVTQVPTTASVNHYYPNYNVNGVSGTATLLVLTSLTNETRGPTAGNPAGIYYALGNVDLNGGVKINGTLIMAGGGELRVQGTGNSITPLRYFPAVVADGNINIKQNNTTLDLAGLTYTGGSIIRMGSGADYNLNINGVLLFSGATPTIDPNVKVKVIYDRYKASVPSLTGATKPVPTGVSIVSWKSQ